MNTEKTKNVIGNTMLGIQYLLLIYFVMALGFFDMFSGIRSQVDIASKIMMPFITIIIPIFNVVHTLIVILVALISVILAVAAKYGDLDKKVIVDIAKIELDKRSDFVKIIFLIKNLIFIWSAWTYGAFYLASIFFLWILLNAWFTQIVEKTVNAMKDRAVEIVAGREE